MIRYIFPFFTILVFAMGCTSEPEPSNQAIIQPKPQINDAEPEILTFQVSMDDLRLRDDAGPKAKIIGNLSEGEQIEYTGESSNFTTPVNLRGYPYDEPWLKVKTTNGQEGWVYGGGVEFGEDLNGPVVQKLIQNRLEKLFGNKLTSEIRSFQQNFDAVNAEEDLATVYRKAISLQEALNQELQDDIEVSDPSKAADMTWLEGALPGFITQLVAEGTIYHLFIYYEDWAKKSRRTKGRIDDQFFELMYDVFPIDHIEHFFPAWFLQTWDYGGHSELGKGVHLDLLTKINKNRAESELFAPELESLKNRLIVDITDQEITYWYDKKAILTEINTILDAEFGILTNEDIVALEVRKKHFQNPVANGIEINFRSGIPQDN